MSSEAWSRAAQQQPRAADRLAQALAAGRLHHAYLLLGGGGDQRRSFAEALASCLLCAEVAPGGPLAGPCRRCPSCLAARGGAHPDLLRVRPGERGGVTIDQVRELGGRLRLSRALGPRRVAILLSADSMARAAQNALLKALEEPPPGTTLLLEAGRPGALAPTLRSRCATVLLAAVGDAPPAEGATPEAALAARLAAALAPGDAEACARLAARADQVAAIWRELVALEQQAGGGGGAAARSSAAQLASAWGRDPEACDLAEGLVAVRARDGLAWHLAGRPPTTAGEPQAALARASACAAALAWARRVDSRQQQRAFHLERLLAALAG